MIGRRTAGHGRWRKGAGSRHTQADDDGGGQDGVEGEECREKRGGRSSAWRYRRDSIEIEAAAENAKEDEREPHAR